MDTLVSASELAAHLANTGWRIVDCRFSLADPGAGLKAYEQGHIPGAHYINLDRHLSSPHVPGKTGRHPLPARADWIATVQALGIAADTQVAMYDDAGGAIAARMWWMLRWIGHGNGAVLNGGWQAWLRGGHPVSTAIPAAPVKSACDFAALPSLVQVMHAGDIDATAHLLLDAREMPRFRGDVEPLDPVAGHIPGALCSPFSANLDAGGCFKAPADLREKFAPAAHAQMPVVCYCGSGVTAAHNVLAMKVAGLDEPALYPGSWSEWITDPSRPVATGDHVFPSQPVV